MRGAPELIEAAPRRSRVGSLVAPRALARGEGRMRAFGLGVLGAVTGAGSPF